MLNAQPGWEVGQHDVLLERIMLHLPFHEAARWATMARAFRDANRRLPPHLVVVDSMRSLLCWFCPETGRIEGNARAFPHRDEDPEADPNPPDVPGQASWATGVALCNFGGTVQLLIAQYKNAGLLQYSPCLRFRRRAHLYNGGRFWQPEDYSRITKPEGVAVGPRAVYIASVDVGCIAALSPDPSGPRDLDNGGSGSGGAGGGGAGGGGGDGGGNAGGGSGGDAAALGRSMAWIDCAKLPKDLEHLIIWGLAVGPDGHLYAAADNTHGKRPDNVPEEDGIRKDDYAYMSKEATGFVLRFRLDPESGTFAGDKRPEIFTPEGLLTRPSGLCFDGNGDLLVTSYHKGVLKFKGPLVGTSSGSGGAGSSSGGGGGGGGGGAGGGDGQGGAPPPPGTFLGRCIDARDPANHLTDFTFDVQYSPLPAPGRLYVSNHEVLEKIKGGAAPVDMKAGVCVFEAGGTAPGSKPRFLRKIFRPELKPIRGQHPTQRDPHPRHTRRAAPKATVPLWSAAELGRFAHPNGLAVLPRVRPPAVQPIANRPVRGDAA